MTKIIWSSDINLKDYEDYFEEENITDENKKYELAYELNNMYLEDERMNLDVELNEDIIAIADFGFWYGRRCGYGRIKGNISECLYSNCDDATWYVDNYNLRCTANHHDGTNYYTYRVFKDGLSETQKENFLEKIIDGKANSKIISRYTKSLKPYIDKVYGW